MSPVCDGKMEKGVEGWGPGVPEALAECVTHQSPRPSSVFGLLCLDKADWFALNPVIYAKLFS